MSAKWQYISSRANPLVVSVSKLGDKKHRREQGLFRFDGVKLFCEAVQRGAPIKYVLVRESSQDICATVEGLGVSEGLYILSDPAFERVTEENAPEGIVTVCEVLGNIRRLGASDAASVDHECALVLESLRDAGNLGTVVRTAGAFGVDVLYMTSDCADLYNPKTVRGAMGALFTQSIVIVDSAAELALELRRQGTHTYAAALHKDAELLGRADLPTGCAIFIGNEGHGLTEGTVDACDSCLLIPMQEGAESLNAAVAASVCMWELTSHRRRT